ncbi:hypothetical protein IMZ48_15625, partial [Candidatus Bathyarchaeota archaeon]|nr:hypothetical protein [Candidatus Bathyarchaeota archaeon]
MAPTSTSPTFLNRLSLSRNGPLLPLHSSARKNGSEYDLEELEPQPSDGLLSAPSPKPVQRRNPRRDSGGRILESPRRSVDFEDPHHPS